MTEAPKPCPFCGGTELEVMDIDEGYAAIACDTCDAFGPMGLGAEGAWREWNHRAFEESPFS
ncbi:Lar family restriction alleviation protein [Thiohalorhabdus sp.]|uniref:Lar family restriction alleviation protein n=1 Tax=Thiohalorhabdus sp. TaxID=3094134 RepID=UPI002FC3AB58